jgi:predicted transcriptional regulator
MNHSQLASAIAVVTAVTVLAGLSAVVGLVSATDGSSLHDGSEPAVETLTPVTENETGTVRNMTEAATDTTENTTGDSTNTTDSVTSTTGDVTDSTTESTGNVTETVNGTTEETDQDLTENLTANTSLSGTPSVESNASVEADASVTLDGERPSNGASSGTASASTLTATSEETAIGEEPPTGERSEPTTATGDIAPAGGDPSDSPFPAPSGAAAGGALAIAGVAVAAGSKHFAASPFGPQGHGLAWLTHTVRLKAQATTDALRGTLGRLSRVVLPLGYSRHDDSDPLDHETRQTLFEAVERSPGVNLSTLADESDASLSTVRHHLRILEEEHLLVSERIRGQRRYFPSNESDPALLAALDDTATQPVLRELAQSGSASVSDLADALGRDPSTISHHVSRLEDDGLVERERDGRSVQNRLSAAAERVLVGSGSVAGEQRPVATE